MGDVYVARRPGSQHIVAAFPVLIDKAVKGELLKQLTKAGFDVDITTEWDVQSNFSLHCSHSVPPLLNLMQEAEREKGDGIDQEDVNAAGPEDLTPDGSADALLDATAEQVTGDGTLPLLPLEDESAEAPASEAEEPDPITAPNEEFDLVGGIAAYIEATEPSENDGREMAPEPHKGKKQKRHNN